MVGRIQRRGRLLTARPFFEHGPRVTLGPAGGPARGRAGARGLARAPREGDLVLLTRAPSGRRGGRTDFQIAAVLGRPDIARDVIEALMLDRGLRRDFDPVVEREARAVSGRAPKAPRRDLRGLPTFTIDPAGARDYDDAISAERVDADTVRVWVHIADVAAYVPAGSPVDREAHRRATSVYVPGAVEPMLPGTLSNDACSLLPGCDRAAVTVEMDLVLRASRGPRVARAAFHRSTIRSDERLDYDRVDRVFAGAERAAEPWARPLEAARAAAATLEQARRRSGALEVATAEPEFSFDAEGHVARMDSSEQTESHRLIEHLMIAANEQVAKLLDERGLGALYRVHERPAPERVQRLVEQLATLEVPTPPLSPKMSPQQAADAVGEISRLVAAHVRATGRGQAALTSLVLRSLKQAYYSPRNQGHAGLHSERYCHFTSPIRRYPDLVCHRALLAAVGAGEDAPRSDRLEELGVWTSAREREAMTIERDADDVARCFSLERVLTECGSATVFEGEVIGVIGAGAFVSFASGYEGMLPVRHLKGDWWELNEQGTILLGAHSGATLRLGDPVSVRVRRVEAPRGRVDLELA